MFGLVLSFTSEWEWPKGKWKCVFSTVTGATEVNALYLYFL